jgi:hypothetical protein
LISLLGFGIWILVYAPNMKLANRDWGEYLIYAPRLGDLFNSSMGATGPYQKIMTYLNLGLNPTFERALGFPLLTLIIYLSLLLLINLPRFTKLFDPKLVRLFNSAIIGTFITFLILAADDAGHSMWFVPWRLVPGLSSVRAPSRILILLALILVILVILLISSIKLRSGARFLCVLLLVLVFIFDNSRSHYSMWTRADYESQNYARVVNTARDEQCSAFYVAPSQSNPQPWITQVEAMQIASTGRIPTINGYSSKTPIGWPQTPYWGRANPEDIRQWVSKFSLNNPRVCYFDENQGQFNFIQIIQIPVS